MQNKTYIAWHAHHECPSPLEFLIESFASRLKIIKTVKAEKETPKQIEIRLKLFKLVKGKLPSGLVAAHKQLDAAEKQWDAAYEQWEAAYKQLVAAEKQWAAADKQLDAACKQWDAAYKQWKAAIKEHMPAILKLHAKECGCGWTPEQPNIFEYMK